MELNIPDVIWYNSNYHASHSLLKTCSSRKIDITDSCTTHDTLGLHTSRGYKSTRSALSIISKRLLYFLGILLSRFSTTTTTIYGFNVGSSHPLAKIRLLCQIRDLKLKVTCYVIDVDTSYNLLLG